MQTTELVIDQNVFLHCGSWKSRFLLWKLVLNSFILIIIPMHDVFFHGIHEVCLKIEHIEVMKLKARLTRYKMATLYRIKIVCKSSSCIPVVSITGTRAFSNCSRCSCSVSNRSKRSSQQKSGGQSNDTLSRRTKTWLNWCLPSLKKCHDIIHESVSLYLRGDDVIRSHRQSAFFSGYEKHYSVPKACSGSNRFVFRSLSFPGR